MTDAKTWKTLDRNDMLTLFAEKPATAIAAMFGVTPGAVYHRLKVFGIGASQVGKHSPGPKKSFNPPKEELDALYATKSMAQIAAFYGVGETVVFTRLKAHGIGGISRSARMIGVRKSAEHVAKLRERRLVQVGDKNPNWKGGISTEGKLARSRRDYRDWKLAVLQKAEFKCERCGVEQGSVCECCGARTSLHAHHKVPFSVNHDLRYVVENGIALCGRCHHQEHFGKSGELLETP
jgi:5-methylcytosine-specific restriction endonuclease McrA